jgi:hypothetical protein
MLSHILPGAEAIASAAFPAQDQATLRVVRREMTWGQYAADYSNRSHQTLAAVMAYKQQVGQANAAADAAAKREEDAEQAARIQAGAAAMQQMGNQIYNASTQNYYPPPPVMQPSAPADAVPLDRFYAELQHVLVAMAAGSVAGR